MVQARLAASVRQRSEKVLESCRARDAISHPALADNLNCSESEATPLQGWTACQCFRVLTRVP